MKEIDIGTISPELFHCKNVVFEILNKEDSEIEPSDVIEMLIHSTTLLEQENNEELSEDLNVWIDTHIDLIDHIFYSFATNTRVEMEKLFLNGFIQDLDHNQQMLSVVQVYYKTLFALWLAREYDPTNGEAWEYLSYVIDRVDRSNFGMIKKHIAQNFLDRESLCPIQDLWKKILHR
tara:strand:+ start:730 stop:1260 length:531 start_codon:yes stop_codon:yes gene_type:complete